MIPFMIIGGSLLAAASCGNEGNRDLCIVGAISMAIGIVAGLML